MPLSNDLLHRTHTTLIRIAIPNNPAPTPMVELHPIYNLFFACAVQCTPLAYKRSMAFLATIFPLDKIHRIDLRNLNSSCIELQQKKVCVVTDKSLKVRDLFGK